MSWSSFLLVQRVQVDTSPAQGDYRSSVGLYLSHLSPREGRLRACGWGSVEPMMKLVGTKRLNDGELGYRVETPSFKSLDT